MTEIVKKIGEIKKGDGYENIGPTAWGVAYDRAQSDIKYAKEIFDEIDAIVKPNSSLEIEYLEHKKRAKNSPQFEARYKLIDRLIAQNKTDQILEIASGLAPRGLAMTEENPSLCYVELDLPLMSEHKRQIINNLIATSKVKQQKNLHIEDGDALDENSLIKATRYFKIKPIAVVNEGLLRYLNFTQKAIVAKNVRTLLKKFGGVWITSDITLKSILDSEGQRKENKELVQALSGINVEENTFESEHAAIIFFENLGFTVEKHSFLEELDELVSPKTIGISLNETKELLKIPVVFVMRLKGV